MTDKQTLFADGILEASVNFGVARITLAQTGSDGKPVPCGQLMLPVVQLPAFTNGMMTLLKQIETKVKQAQAQQGIATAEAIKPEDVPGAFRFAGS
jgi:ABC-type phosphate transport system permease subunit